MREWLILLAAVVVTFAVLVYMGRRVQTEGFTTVDLPTATAQRQMLQFEGERRYNPLAAVQNPGAQIPADQVLAAVQQTVPVPSTRTASLMELLGMTTVGAADDGSGKVGQGVEQTGVVQQKINFCESLTTIDCTQLNDPRLAECGFCLKDGRNSKGQVWRGGMYISADDQIRANEVSNAAGGVPAKYKPTVGTCAPDNFTLMQETCQVRDAQLKCMSAGAATSSNQCGQCYGASIGSTSGLMFVGPKPRSYPAVLWVSHPGSHTLDATGDSLVVKNAAGTTVGNLKYSSHTLLDPQSISLTITEGDNLTITVAGVPQIWCGWLSSTDGKRTVSLDVGAQSVLDGYGRANIFQVAGDKRSGTVTALTAKYDTDTWTTFQVQVPNTVMWYTRTEGVPGMVTSAWYGSALPPTPLPASGSSAATNGAWVTQQVQQYIGSGQTIVASPAAFGIADPAPGLTKALTIWLDNGQTVTIADGQSFQPTQNIPQMFPRNQMTMALTVPATLVDPIFASDIRACPTGPLVLTEIGAGLMGSHSCYNPDGSFNPNQYCMQELFQAAGGTPQGTAYPSSPAAIQQLVVNDPKSGKPSLDLTVQQLNNLGSVALYGTDTQGNPATWGEIKSAALSMLGVTMTNPCDGPTAQTGPHSAECLDFLWRTAGAAAQPNLSKTSLASVPYAYCAAAGTAAPLNPDGSVNQANVDTANGYGALPAVQNYFQTIYKRALDPSDFDAQATAMQQCFNITMPPPIIDNTACPPPAPTDWQCMPPTNFLLPEVFMMAKDSTMSYNSTQAEAPGICASVGATEATMAQLTAAQQAGAQWCSASWVSDDTTNAYYPMQQAVSGCGNSAGVQTFSGAWLPNTASATAWTTGGGDPATAMATVTCYGVKPPPGTPNVAPWSPSSWNNPAANQAAPTITNTAIPAMREVNSVAGNQVQCASTDGQNCYMFSSLNDCAAWTDAPTINPAISQAAPAPTTVTSLVDTYLRSRN